MDPIAFSLALGILVLVLNYSCFGIGWGFSLAIALGATLAMRIAGQVAKHRKTSTPRDFKREPASKLREETRASMAPSAH